ncbi:MAG TPA: hypothetical protein V6C86_12245 [Oculatellaceae cyanobacterium]
MHRQLGGHAMAWQTAQQNSTFERPTLNAERGEYILPETIALNSESGETASEDVEVKSSSYLGSVSLVNERPSKILRSAHLAIADQSPFNLRNTDPRLPLKELSAQIESAPHVVAEVFSSSVPVPLPPRSNFDASAIELPLPMPLAGAQKMPEAASVDLAVQDYRPVTESYRGPNDTVLFAKNTTPAKEPENLVQTPTVSTASLNFDAQPKTGIKSAADADTNHLNAAWGVPERPAGQRGALSSLLPGVGGASKKSAVGFEGALTAARTVPGDNNNLKAIKAADALGTGRMGTNAAARRDANRMQTCSNLPLFDTNSMRVKMQAANVTFSKSISPDGERTQIQTAPDFSSITEVWTPSANGGYAYKGVYRDELNRVRYEESICEQGLKTIVQTGYCDQEDKKSPFVAYKMVIKPDGSRELLA